MFVFLKESQTLNMISKYCVTVNHLPFSALRGLNKQGYKCRRKWTLSFTLVQYEWYWFHRICV